MPDPTPSIIGAAVALVLLFLALVIRGQGGRRPAAIALAAAAPVAAAIAAYYAQSLTLNVPPTQFVDAALLAGVVAIPLAAGMGLAKGKTLTWLGIAIFALVSAAVFYGYTETLHERYWGGRVLTYVGCLSGLATLAFAARLGAEGLGRTTEAALGTGIIALAAAPALGWSGTGVSALTVASVSASAGLFGLILVSLPLWRSESSSLGRAAATTQTMLLAGLIANGVLYAETPKKAGAMLMGAHLVLLLPGRSVWASFARLVLIAAVAGGAAYLCKGEPSPYGH